MKRIRYVKPSVKKQVDTMLASAVHMSEEEAANKYASQYRSGNGAYDPKYPGIANFLCRRGATRAELADAFDVSTQAIDNWAVKYPAFGEAIAEGKDEVFDPRVERALAERALGYSVDIEEYFVVDKELVSRTIRKHYPPDVTACIFWLKNRQSDRWRDVQRHEISTGLKSSDELRQALVSEFNDLVKAGLLVLPGRKMKEINPPKGNGRGT